MNRLVKMQILEKHQALRITLGLLIINHANASYLCIAIF
jgi:hypothetical protein